jgi:hypothetical protein
VRSGSGGGVPLAERAGAFNREGERSNRVIGESPPRILIAVKVTPVRVKTVIVLLLVLGTPAAASELRGKVIQMTDGDTITIPMR